MKRLNYKQWSIQARLVSIAIFPIILLVTSAVGYAYYSSSTEVQNEMDERGALLARTLSAGSEYGVISGNVEFLEKISSRVLSTDKSIRSVRIMSNDGSISVLAGVPENDVLGGKTYSTPIVQETLDINLFDQANLPPPTQPASANSKKSTKAVGVVRITMTPDSILGKKKSRNFLALIATLAAVLLCGGVGLLLAHSLSSPLNEIIAALKAIRNGNYQAKVKVTDSGEIGELQSTANEMAASLNDFKNSMESKVSARTESLRSARDDAVRSNDEKRKLIRKVHSAVEEERKSISVEIHDHLNAALIVIRLEVQRILDLSMKPASDALVSKIHQTAQSVMSNTADLYEVARDIVKRLRPEIIDTLGLRDAIQEMVSNYNSLSDCRFIFKARGDFSVIESDLAITAYRLVQEAFSNVMKHSRATQVNVVMDVDDEAGLMSISIIDNGIGFNPDDVVPGIGLIGMRERVHAALGKIDIHPAIPAGTMINIALPTTSAMPKMPSF